MILSVVLAALSASAGVVSAQQPKRPYTVGAWMADSYSINGKCYCDSTFDGGLKSVLVTGPDGNQMPVTQACALVGTGPGKNTAGAVKYNDIQCGNGPPHPPFQDSQGRWYVDEQPGECPGRVDLGNGVTSGCAAKGPKWQFPSAGNPGVRLNRHLPSE